MKTLSDYLDPRFSKLQDKHGTFFATPKEFNEKKQPSVVYSYRIE